MVNTRNVLLWLHILVAMLTLGPLVLYLMLMPGLVRSGNVEPLRFWGKVAKPLGPLTMLIALLGIALVLRSDDDPYTFRTGWIVAGLVLYLVMLGNGVGILGRAADRAVERLDAGQDASGEVRTLQLFGAVNIVTFLVILWLMVAKPGM